MTMTRYADEVIQLNHRQRLQFDFDLFGSDGTVHRHKGAWYLCDGGFHKWRCLQCPVKMSPDVDTSVWSKWIESMRKDVECCFGILKGRWRILKTGLLIQDANVVGNIFKTCVCLHNELLEHDGLDESWEHSVEHEYEAGLHHAEDIPRVFNRLAEAARVPSADLSSMAPVQEVAYETDSAHVPFRQSLIDHFNYRLRQTVISGNNISWPSRNGEVHRVGPTR